MKCDICKTNETKYKCPKCRSIKYCSVACYKNHSLDNCTSDSQNASVEMVQNTQLYPTEDTIPPEKLNLLCYDTHLKELVSNSYLQKIMEKIDNSTNPNEELEKAMIEPMFEEFARRCIDIVRSENSN
ncbi:zinc finger HIT domain-containing protein 3 [Sipha flava]|uniref:Zinc finger HIT domain-containing protein 3 n=1 Tax=Sipha flava TaxID=143950 RepID=A0A2S2QAJ3_9HEMI|nr:zinc finger HIT domain-containing protein 3 [Sipha flava]XP_025408987.1 zinc finger HIT domain-containing protein 3 [Sipha flava]